jgi:hypothetical protein
LSNFDTKTANFCWTRESSLRSLHLLVFGRQVAVHTVSFAASFASGAAGAATTVLTFNVWSATTEGRSRYAQRGTKRIVLAGIVSRFDLLGKAAQWVGILCLGLCGEEREKQVNSEHNGFIVQPEVFLYTYFVFYSFF